MPLGEQLKLWYTDKYRWLGITVLEAHRGPGAWNRLLDADPTTGPPPADMEYVLLYIELEYYVKSRNEKAARVTRSLFDMVSKGQIVASGSVIEPEPTLPLVLSPNESGSVWLAWMVFTDDSEPLLAVAMSSRGVGSGRYFALRR